MARFSDEEIRRYSRQILLREVGGRGQAQLQAARPVLVCQGEVGHLTAEYLWRAGVTALGLFAATPELAAQLSAQLGATGYPGSPARALAEAAPPVQLLAQAAPDFTLLWFSDPVRAAGGLEPVGAAGGQEPAGAASELGPLRPAGELEKAHAAGGQEPLLWACCRGSWGVVGQGSAELQAAFGRQRDLSGAVSGAGAMIVGSALALLAVQRILGITEAVTESGPRPGALWQLDLDRPQLPQWQL